MAGVGVVDHRTQPRQGNGSKAIRERCSRGTEGPIRRSPWRAVAKHWTVMAGNIRPANSNAGAGGAGGDRRAGSAGDSSGKLKRLIWARKPIILIDSYSRIRRQGVVVVNLADQTRSVVLCKESVWSIANCSVISAARA